MTEEKGTKLRFFFFNTNRNYNLFNKKHFSNFKSLYMLVHGTQMYICVNVDLNPVIYVQIDFRTSLRNWKDLESSFWNNYASSLQLNLPILKSIKLWPTKSTIETTAKLLKNRSLTLRKSSWIKKTYYLALDKHLTRENLFTHSLNYPLP